MAYMSPGVGTSDRRIPNELMVILAFGIAIFAVVASGSAISSMFSEPSPWLFAAAYGGPAALVFGLYWLAARRFHAAQTERRDPAGQEDIH